MAKSDNEEEKVHTVLHTQLHTRTHTQKAEERERDRRRLSACELSCVRTAVQDRERTENAHANVPQQVMPLSNCVSPSLSISVSVFNRVCKNHYRELKEAEAAALKEVRVIYKVIGLQVFENNQPVTFNIALAKAQAEQR